MEGRDRAQPPLGGLEARDGRHPPHALLTFHMDNRVERGSCVQCDGALAEARERSQRNESRRNVCGGVRVKCGEASVAGIESEQHLAHFGAATFPHDESIRPHSQRFTHQLREANGASAIHIGTPFDKAHHMRVGRSRFSRLFNQHEPLTGVDLAHQRGQESGLAGARRTGDDERRSRGHEAAQHRVDLGVHHPQAPQVIPVKRRTPYPPQRHRRAAISNWRQDGVEPGAVRKPRIHGGTRIVQALAA